MKGMNKASVIANIVGKMAYAMTSVMVLTKAIGKKAHNVVYFRAKWTVEISSIETGLVLVENRKKTLPEILEIAKSLEDAKVRIVLERSN